MQRILDKLFAVDSLILRKCLHNSARRTNSFVWYINIPFSFDPWVSMWIIGLIPLWASLQTWSSIWNSSSADFGRKQSKYTWFPTKNSSRSSCIRFVVPSSSAPRDEIQNTELTVAEALNSNMFYPLVADVKRKIMVVPQRKTAERPLFRGSSSVASPHHAQPSSTVGQCPISVDHLDPNPVLPKKGVDSLV